ncbi:MAG TPA: hypothetical protein VHM00_15375 [Caldimonas sp.]|jgi:hypothetical protein|nr:hypothetical protein [Caldimonas sp.]HEX2542451.1 hypothetical protein [Caldimonas sp.]
MDVTHAASRLRALASDHARRSKTAVLADVFGHIENAIRAGVPHAAIVEELVSLGLDINLGAFRSALRRLRAGHAAISSAQARLAPTQFAGSSFADDRPSVRATSSGSLYDEGALCRLLRASASSPPRLSRDPARAD